MNRSYPILSLPTMRASATALLCLFILNTATAQKQSAQVIYKGNGVLAYVNKKGSETELTKNASDSTAIVYDNNIFLIEQDMAAVGENKITLWDIKKKSAQTLVSPGTQADQGYTIKDKIVHIVIDKRTNRLFFSTFSEQSKQYSTWSYDLTTGKTKSFSDGLVKEVDDAGSVTVVFYNKDYIGKYTQQVVFSANRVLLSMEEKKY